VVANSGSSSPHNKVYIIRIDASRDQVVQADAALPMEAGKTGSQVNGIVERSGESWRMPNVRLIKHEAVLRSGSLEVRFSDGRPSRYFY
jgi:hypothetical protein